MKIGLPENVKTILQTLNDNGYDAYAVGGCVRDAIMGRIPQDWDITTEAMPEQVKALFARTVDTGIEHGTVTVLFGRESYEVTTFRTDGVYLDGRHPESVNFVSDLNEDLLRRDFTINAMAYNEDTGIIDPYDGQVDLKDRIIRCVGNPRERFSEDALRMLRAIRFACQLNFRIEEKTLDAIRELAPNITLVSKERIQTELVKIVSSGHPENWMLACETGLKEQIIPQWGECADLALRMTAHIRDDRMLKLGAFFYPMDSACIRTILEQLKFDNLTTDKVSMMARLWSRKLSGDPIEVRRVLSTTGDDIFLYSLEIQETVNDCTKADAGEKERIENVRRTYEAIRARGDCTAISQLAVTGKDLILDGVPQGPGIGEALKAALEEVLPDPDKNTKEYLMRFIRSRRTENC